MSEGTALLISWLRFGESPLDERYIPRAIDALTRLHFDLATLDKGSDSDDIIKILRMVANTVQVEMPEEDGLVAYVALLQHLPRHVIQLAALDVLRTHTYRTMPLPAELLASTEVASWLIAISWIRKFIGIWKEELTTRL